MAENNFADYRYPDLTPGSTSNNGKYWHELNQASQDALNTVQQWVEKENIDLKQLGTNDLHPALLILRYLRANQFNATKTITHIQKNLEWRRTMNVAALVSQRPEEILGCTLEELTSVFPHWHSGYDKTGRPVLYKQYGKFEAGLIKKLVGGKTFDNVVRYHLWEQEACGRLCLAQSLKDKTIVETITGVIDIKDMGMSQITSDFLKLTKALAEIDQNQYPETLGRAFIINAPAAFPLVWRMVKPWLDPATVAKIQVLGGPKEFIPVLQDFIGEENLPSNYGGMLPPLSPQVHPYVETMATYPAENTPVEETKVEEEVFDEAVLQYPYPELTPGAAPNNGKYWQQLTDPSQEALTAVQQWVQQDRVNLKQLGTTDLHPSLMLLRYLRANQFNAKKTIVHLQKNIEWRRTKDIDSLILQRPEVILGCSLEELTAVFPHWHSGYDKTGRPVLYKQYGKFEAGLVKKLVGGTFDNVVKYHLWEQEACGRLCLAQSKKTGKIVETITGVIDIKDMGMSQITSDFLKLTKALAEIDQNQYPETLGRAFIINAPAAFPLVWRMVKPWLDPATVAKIQVLGGPKEFIPVLQDFIGEENLPSNYGGTLPPLSPQVHPYAETMQAYPTEVETPKEEKAELFDPKVLLYPYPELTPGSAPDNGKYWQQLSLSGQEALGAVEQWVARDKVDLRQLGTTDLHPALMLLRYLRANQFNAKKTIAHLQKNIEWRRTKDIDSLILQRPEVILGCSLEELTAVFPHWHSGYDKTGRPVLYKQYGKFEAGLVKKLGGGSFDNVVRYHLWEQEACGRLCLAQSKKTGLIVETITGVIDIKDMGMSQITRDFLSLTKLLAEIDQNQYPETLGRAFIINAPAAFPLVWRMVKPWLDPATVAKIQVLGGPKEFIPVLRDFIGEENLPSNYGGSLPPLSPQVHPYAETMQSYTDAAVSNDADARAAYARANDRNSFRNSRNTPRRNSSRNLAQDAATDQPSSSSLLYYPNLLWTGIQKNWFLGTSPEDDNESAWEGDSDKSDESDDELHFEDAFESQSDLETNSHSHLYSAKPTEGTSTAPPRKKKRSWWGKLFLVKATTRCYRRLVFDKQIRRLTLQRLETRFITGAAVHLLCAIGCAAISGTALAEIAWSSEGARLQLWAFTVVLLVSCFMIIFDFVGYYGLQTKNWPLLVMYACGIIVGTLLFAACTIACFLYYSLPGITGVGNSSLNSTLSENRSFMISLAIGCLFVALCGVVPLTFVRGVIIKLRELQGRHLQTRQIQIVLKIAQSISTIAAIVMLCYGGLGMEYLLKIQYAASLFAVYGLVYGGVSVLITSTIGVWVSNTVHRSVLRLYQYFVLPFIVSLLLIIALVCFDDLYHTEQDVHDAYPDLETSESEEKVKSNVQTFLLVTGILTIVLCVFQTLSLVATRALSSTIDSNGQVKEKIAILQAIKEKELGIYSTGLVVNGEEVLNKDSYWAEFSVEHLGRLYMLYSRNQRDRFLIAWGVAMGLFNIFVNGTLAVFSRYASGSSIRNNWMFGLLEFLGRADTRFVISNAYLRSSETLLAVLIGPLMLMYAWSTFVYAPYRHVLGMLVSSSQILIWILYIVIELYSGLKHFQGRQAPVLLSFMLIFGSIAYVFIPGWILYKEVSVSTNDTSTSDSHELLMEANNETKPFLDKYDFENLESGTMYDASNGRPPTGKKARASESSLEQMLGMGRGNKSVSPEPTVADDASTASTRSFIRGLGSESIDSNTELELYRARAATAFTTDSASRATKPLYADKISASKMSIAQKELNSPEGADAEDTTEEKKDDDGAGSTAAQNGAPRFPLPLSPSRGLSSPTRVRGLNDHFGTPTIPEESRLSFYSPSGPVPITLMPPLPPPQIASQDRLGNFLRQRSVAPLRPRVSLEGQVTTKTSLAGGITQVAAATAALDPNKILPMLMKLGVSSVEAAGMMTYLMRMKELGEGRKKKNSLAMVV